MPSRGPQEASAAFSAVVDPDEKSLAGRITEVLESGVKPDTSVLQEFSAGSTAGKFLSLTDE